MKWTRRQVLTGVAGVTAGTGAVIGSTAFTQVEADRDFDVAIAQDADAQLRLTPNDDVDVVSAETVGDAGLELLSFDIDRVATDGGTVFENAFSIANQSEVADSFFVHLPRATDSEGSGISNAQQESMEFLADTTNEAVVSSQGNGESNLIDISLPPEYPGDVGDPVFSANPGNPDNVSSSSLGKVTNTGAIELGYEQKVEVDLRVLDFPGDLNKEFSFVYRFVADRTDPPDELSDWEPTANDEVGL